MSLEVFVPGCCQLVKEVLFPPFASFPPLTHWNTALIDQKDPLKSLNTKIQELASRMGVHRPFEIRYNSFIRRPCIVGNGLLFSSKIVLPTKLVEKKPERSKDEILAIIARQLAHIKNRDPLKKDAVYYSTLIITSVMLSILFPTQGLIPIILSAMLASYYVMLRFFSSRMESKAEEVAFEYLTPPQKNALAYHIIENRDDSSWLPKTHASSIERAYTVLEDLRADALKKRSWFPLW